MNHLVDNNVVLGALPASINDEEALHQELVLTDDVAVDFNSDGGDDDAAKTVTEEDTMIKICNHPGCGKLRLAMPWRIHQFECHKVVVDTNSGEDMNVDG